MTPHFERVALIGVGLLGGSLGMAMKERGIAGYISGVGRRKTSIDAAIARGAIDRGSDAVAEHVAAADLIVICTPAAQVTGYLDLIRPMCKASAIVTDVASTKQLICNHARDTWPHPLRFVGSHPMAGSEKFGVENARADLYDGCVTVVEDGPHLAPDARTAIASLWRAVGATVAAYSPAAHDALAARTSHMPHVLAACVAQIVAKSGDAAPLVGQGFRDVTRIAASRPEIWRDICLTNGEAILQALAEVDAELNAFKRALELRDAAAIERYFDSGRAARNEVLGS